ncbi:MAG: hypothetical protein A2139_14300 [Desulfobacca sp. RBG_16_60_12]|nr:MAG: hypothetical protein A2139_14300 [Desulfobacca sp. RBG_16_60_12]
MQDNRPEIRPQAGPQEAFLATSADIAVYGGAAGAGKSFALLMEPTRHVHRKRFGAVIFRRTYKQITNEGGLWDSSLDLYPHLGAIPRQNDLQWVFPSHSKVTFAHMQHEDDRYQWDGAQIPYIGFDQLEHFSFKQFSYMLSRNRSTCGVVPYIRATANPNPDHWLRTWMAWWIDDTSGLPIPERGGVVRWFVIREDQPVWADTPTELHRLFGARCGPKSFAFIPGTVFDNKILVEKNPQYLANLQALCRVDRERLLGGNWNARESAGMFFRREWFEVVPAAPSTLTDIVRYWDRAATAAQAADPQGSWTVGLKMGRDRQGCYWVLDVVRFQGSAATVQSSIKNTASQDGERVRVGIEQDPGQAGKVEAQLQVANLAGYNARVNPVREAKGVRARGLSAQAEVGNLKLIRAPWNEAYLRELENFDGSEGCMADQVDASSGAFLMLTKLVRAGAFKWQ